MEWSWLRTYEETLEAWATLTDPDYLFSSGAEDALTSILRSEFGGALPEEESTFDHTVLPLGELYAKQFQYAPCNDGIAPTIHGLTAAMGAFSLYAVAKGSIEPLEVGHRITVTGVSVFVRDSFDFDYQFQLLGDWSCEDLRFNGGVGTDNVTNGDFQDFRTRHGKGGDFYVYAQPRAIDSVEEHSYDFES